MKLFLPPAECDVEVRSWTSPHYLSRNERVTAAGRLCLILPGTKGQPRDYRSLADQAADLGLHALVLRYPNDEAVNDLAGGDLAAHQGLRERVLQGGGGLPAAESIRTRLIAVLREVDRRLPGQGWDNFLDSGEVVWGRVCIVGHSLGGGYAAMIAMRHLVERCVALGWADWDRKDGCPALWVQRSPWATPVERRFMLNHLRDEMVPESVARSMVSLLCPGAGEAVVESVDPPFGYARVLWTDLDPGRQYPTLTPCHNSLALDVEVPRFWDDTNMLLDAWTWLLVGEDPKPIPSASA
ncbi:MAG: hypothetical protein H6686_07700 [Fibrobacteria bacterium]|nr:hypothetical protein [Fibrobacteria bacterium]